MLCVVRLGPASPTQTKSARRGSNSATLRGNGREEAQSDADKNLKALREHEDLLRKYSVTRIGLFGSFARGQQKRGSCRTTSCSTRRSRRTSRTGTRTRRATRSNRSAPSRTATSSSSGSRNSTTPSGGRYRQLYGTQYHFERDRFINPGEDFTPEPAAAGVPSPAARPNNAF